MTDRTELRRMLEKATPGPWALYDGWLHEGRAHVARIGNAAGNGIWATAIDMAGEIADFELIAAAVNALPDLLNAAAELERIREGRDDSPRDEDRWATPGQMWAMLIDSPPSERTVLLEAALRAMDAEHRCIIGFHQEAGQQRDALLDRLAHMTEARDNARAEVERWRELVAGRCMSDTTHHDEEHRQSVCMLPEGHAPLAHDDCMGCTWTDADHWRPQAVDRLADELRAVADESQHEGWDSPAVRRVVERLTAAFDGGEQS